MEGLTWTEIAQAALWATLLAVGVDSGYLRTSAAIMLFASIFAYAPLPSAENLASIFLHVIAMTLLVVGVIQMMREPSR